MSMYLKNRVVQLLSKESDETPLEEGKEMTFFWKSILPRISNSNSALCRGILGENILSAGSGPVSEDDFDEMLLECNIQPHSISGDGGDIDMNVLVIGREDWQKADLDRVVKSRAGKTLRVYSQEMVIASLAVGDDVYQVLSESELKELGAGHPALEFLEQRRFDWPTTTVEDFSHSTTVSFAAMNSPETGLLSHMGYRVGQSGLVQESRREILDEVMVSHLVPASAHDRLYAEQWGKPSSPRRLKKLADCLASFAKSHKRMRSRDYSEAIADWESDLDYLRTVYSHLRSDFDWPTTVVW